MNELLAVVLTLALGPGICSFLAYVVYRENRAKKFPVGIHDGIGDIIMLPVFNAIAVNRGIFGIRNLPAGVLSLILSCAVLIFFVWMVKKTNRRDWSYDNGFNAGGYYHLGFMLTQSWLIFYTLLLFYSDLLVWLPLMGFAVLVIGQWIVDKRFLRSRPNSKKKFYL